MEIKDVKKEAAKFKEAKARQGTKSLIETVLYLFPIA